MGSVDEIKARIDIVDLVSESVKLRRTGKNYSGFCPFHSNTRTPAFVVFPESGTWRCFGQCNEGGDIFKFVMKKEGWDFPEALRRLAERAGVQLEAYREHQEDHAETYQKLRTLLEEAVTFYRHHLLNTSAGKNALAYLKKRGLTDSTIEQFGLGYAPESWDATLQHFLSRNYSEQDLLDAGLVTRRDSGGCYDRFRNRITIPIRDATGKMAGFGARILNPEDIPKFLNSPQTVIFDKGRLLYGLDVARKAIRAADQVVIVEGYLDVIALHQGGFANAVSPMGTALTEDQLRLIKRFTRRIVLALDADAAGQKATLRGLEIARQAMDHTQELAFDARGLLRSEARLQADVRVTTLPEGMDPDDVVNRDPAEWQRLVEAAKPVVIHVMETLAQGQNLEDAKVKSSIAAQVLPLITDVADPVERDAYRQRLARLLRVDERSLIASAARPAQEHQRTRFQKDETPAKPASRQHKLAPASTAALELHCLGLMLTDPDLLCRADRSLQQERLARINVQDFDSTDAQLLAGHILAALDQVELEPGQYLASTLPEALSDLAQQAITSLKNLNLKQDQLVEELRRGIIRLRLIRLNRDLNQIRYLMEDAQNSPGDNQPEEPYPAMVAQYLKTRDNLDKALKPK